MNCPNCGTQINDLNVKYCESCGIELSLKKETSNANESKSTTLKIPTRRKHCC